MNEPINEAQILTVLEQGEIELSGRFVYGSNATLLAHVRLDEWALQAVYKPQRGERPLWDFPAGTLAGREVAAYEVSRALGWHLVPETVLREQAPAGPGSLQRYLELEAPNHYFNLSPANEADAQRVALFDALINNADRKAGHVLQDESGRLWLIDHGISFHREDKLRTVIWEFADQPIPQTLIEDLDRFDQMLAEQPLRLRLAALLTPEEIEALSQRTGLLLEAERFPVPGEQRHYPWPLI